MCVTIVGQKCRARKHLVYKFSTKCKSGTPCTFGFMYSLCTIQQWQGYYNICVRCVAHS